MGILARLMPLGLAAAVLSVPAALPTAGAAPVPVAMLSMSFSPATVTVVLGGSVTWNNNSGRPHNSTSKQGFWKTATIGSGSVSRVFKHSGSFGYYCTVHGTIMSGTAKVQLKAPAGAANGFTLRWSAVGSSLTNRSFDVQKNAPGSDTGWTALRTNTTTRSAFLNPTRNGTWRYRARTDNRTNGKSSGWSPEKSVSVS